MSVTVSTAPAATAGRAGVDPARALSLARDVLNTEANAIAGLAPRIGEAFVAALALSSTAAGGSSFRASGSPDT
jgi:hypothetical protein